MTLMSLEIGGAETHTVILARHMQELGYRVLMASAGGIYEETIAGYGIKHYLLPLNNSRFSSLYHSIHALKRIIREERVVLIHAHARIPAFAANFACHFTGARLLTTAHAMFAAGFPWRHLSRWGEKTIAVSADVREHLINSLDLPEHNIILIPNGIDVDTFKPDLPAAEKLRLTFCPNSDKIIITYISRLDRYLAPVAVNLIEACGALNNTVPLKLLIIGAGVCFSKVAEQAQKINAAAGVSLVELLGARTDINLLMSASDLVVGVSRVALEAMASAKNVLLAGGEGYAGLIQEDILPLLDTDNFTGRQFNKQPSAEDFKQAIMDYMRLPESDKTNRGIALRQHIVQHYSSLHMAKETAKVYEYLLRGKVR